MEDKKGDEIVHDTVYVNKDLPNITIDSLLQLQQLVDVYQDSLQQIKRSKNSPVKIIERVDSSKAQAIRKELSQKSQALLEALKQISDLKATSRLYSTQITGLSSQADSLEILLANYNMSSIKDSVVNINLRKLESELSRVSAAYNNLKSEKQNENRHLSGQIDSLQILLSAERSSQAAIEAAKPSELNSEPSVNPSDKENLVLLEKLKLIEANLANSLKENETFKLDKESEVQLLTRQIDSLNRALTFQKSLQITNKSITEKKSNKANSERLSEAFRIYLEAKAIEPKDPTLAMKLMNYAYQLSKDSIIEDYYVNLPRHHIFYENVLNEVAPIRQASIGSNRIIVISNKGAASYYSFENKDSVYQITTFNGVSTANISEKYILILGGKNGSVRLYNTAQEKTIRTLNVSKTTISSVINIGNPMYSVAVGTGEKEVKVFDKKFKEVASFVGMKRPVTSIDANPSTGYIVTGCGDLNPRVYNPDGKLLLKVKDQPDSVVTVAISPSSKYFLSANKDGKTKIWTTAGELKVIGPNHDSPVISSVFITDQLVATGDSSGQILVWNGKGEIVHQLNGHLDAITSLIYRGGKNLYSSSLDGTLKKWTLQLPQTEEDLPPLSEAEKKRFNIN
ncbi:MAG: hypothetical protein RIC35_22245 [Marinoscillum sp.]